MAKKSTRTARKVAKKTAGKTLTLRQELFARLCFDGMPAYKAYTEAGYVAKTPEIAYANASRLTASDKVQAYINGLRQAADRQEVLSFEEKRKMLATMAKKPDESLRDRQKAIEIDNKMAGHDAPQVVEVKGSLIDQLRG